MAVIDCFPFNGEWNMLDARLAELEPIVDYHVLVEATQTFVGDWKAPAYNPCITTPLIDKILHYVVTFPPHLTNPWQREGYQRDICRGILDEICRPTDIVLFSDIDEIPRSSAWAEIDWRARQEGPVRLETEQYVFSLQLKSPHPDPSRARAFMWMDNTGARTLSRIRFGMFPTAAEACWHFSWFGSKDDQLRKLDSFAHSELNTAEFRQRLFARDHDGLDTHCPLLMTNYTNENAYEQVRLVHHDDEFPIHIVRALDPKFDG